MRSTNSPTPTGNEKETTFMRGLLRKIRDEFNFFDSPTVRVEQTTRGIRFHARPAVRGSSGPSTGGNINMRGLWSATPSTPYMTYDAVILQSGTSTGVYWSMIDNNSNAPDSGLGWIQIATVQGQWL
jgi:hypothetical protein